MNNRACIAASLLGVYLYGNLFFTKYFSPEREGDRGLKEGTKQEIRHYQSIEVEGERMLVNFWMIIGIPKRAIYIQNRDTSTGDSFSSCQHEPVVVVQWSLATDQTVTLCSKPESVQICCLCLL